MRTADAPGDPLLTSYRAVVERSQGRPALIDGRGRAMGFAELDERTRARAIWLRTAADAGQLVALSAPPGVAFVEAFLALLYAGVTVALVDHGGTRAAREGVARAIGARCAWFPADDGGEGDLVPLQPERPAAREDLRGAAVVKLTSGTSGTPKGVLVSGAALHADGAHLVNEIGLGPNDRGLCVIPLSHSYGLSVLVLPLLVAGVPIVLPGDAPPLDVAREAGATFLPSVPAWFQTLLAIDPPEAWRGPLRVLMSAGAPLEPGLAREIRAHTGLGVHVLYGSSEVGAITYDRTGTAAERGTVGTPVAGVTVELTEPEGRVSVRSPARGDGPWPPDAPTDLDGDVFLAADRGEWREGELALLGRVDRLVNVRGKKVDPAAVEAALVALEGVAEACVVGVELPGSNGTTLRAVVAAEASATLVVGALLRELSATLAAHEIPRGIVLVERLPRTVRGKVDRSAVLALARGGR